MVMADHLSISQLKKLCVSALPEEELAAAAAHTAECQSCHQQFVAELKRQRGPVPFNFTLEPAFWLRDDHVDFELLVALADKTLDQEAVEITNIHLQSCETCREDVRSFLAYRDTTASELNPSYARVPNVAEHKRPSPLWWRPLLPRPVYAVAALVLLAVALLIGVIALNRSAGSFEVNNRNSIVRDTEQSPDVSPSPASSSPQIGDNSTTVAILRDRGGEVTIYKDGGIAGLDDVSQNGRQYIARAALSERIETAEVLKLLSSEQSELRGTNEGPQEFRLLSPVRSVVVEDRPVLRWESLPDAASYRVYVLDANGKQVNQSEELPPTRTQWKAPSPLRRGQVFSWVVSAVLDGKKVVAPSASAPEVRFAVLSTADFKELGRLRKSNSHLALGTFYARTGLLNEAEREFESLIKLNPDSELARKLLQSVRATKKENADSFKH